MTATLDRRVRRSRRLLGEALLALVLERDFGAITVQEIADRADLNRATFYLHFASKEELLIAALVERFDEFLGSLEQLDIDPLWTTPQVDRLTFRHVAEHAALYRKLLIHRTIAYMARHITEKLQAGQTNGVTLDIPPEIIGHYAAGGLYALVKWWLDHDMSYSPDEMAQMSFRLCSFGAQAVIHAHA
jgi:AcrR family transcriptional regulator